MNPIQQIASRIEPRIKFQSFHENRSRLLWERRSPAVYAQEPLVQLNGIGVIGTFLIEIRHGKANPRTAARTTETLNGRIAVGLPKCIGRERRPFGSSANGFRPLPYAQCSIMGMVCDTHSMSKRLQVLIPDQEMSDIQRLARRQRLTVGEWVRRTLREARAQQPVNDSETKLKAVRRAVEYSFPTAALDRMLAEIERGYHD